MRAGATRFEFVCSAGGLPRPAGWPIWSQQQGLPVITWSLLQRLADVAVMRAQKVCNFMDRMAQIAKGAGGPALARAKPLASIDDPIQKNAMNGVPFCGHGTSSSWLRVRGVLVTPFAQCGLLFPVGSGAVSPGPGISQVSGPSFLPQNLACCKSAGGGRKTKKTAVISKKSIAWAEFSFSCTEVSMRTLCYILGVFGARDTPTHLIRVVANFSLDGVAARLACAALRKLPMMMGVRRGGSDFARGSCLPARPDLPVGAGNWRGAGSPRPFYSNTMTDGRADRVAPHRGAAVVIGGAPTLLLDGEPCGPGVPGSQVLRRGGVIRFAAGPQMPAGGGSGGGLCPFWQAARAVPPGPPLSVGVV